MIKRLELENFQSHRESHLDFHPGVNIIVGTSDSGKTAIIRAIKWLKDNRPLGDEFRSHWGGDTRVMIHLDDKLINRMKGKSENSYILSKDKPGPDPTIFKAFGTDIPEPIKDILNMSDINVQNQLDSPFLLTKSPGEVANHFNRIAHLEDIDYCIKNIQKEINSIESQTKHDKLLQEKRTEQLKGFDYLDMMEIDLENLEGMEQDYQQKIKSKSRLTAQIEKIEFTENKIEAFSAILRAEKEVDDILVLLSDKTLRESKFDRLQSIYTRIQELQNGIQDYGDMISDEKPVNDILELFKQKKEIETRKGNLIVLGVLINKTETRIEQVSTGLKEREQEFETQFPDVCPLCGSNVKNHKHEAN